MRAVAELGRTSPIRGLTTRTRTEAGVIPAWFEMLATLLARSRHSPCSAPLVTSRGQLCGTPAMLGAGGSARVTFLLNRAAAALTGFSGATPPKFRSALRTNRGDCVSRTTKIPAAEEDMFAPDGLGGIEVARTVGATLPGLMRVTDSSASSSCIVIIRNAAERPYTRCSLGTCRVVVDERGADRLL
jgi:hypothetical protein